MKCKISFLLLAFCFITSPTLAQNEAITLRLAIPDQQGSSNIEPYVTELIAQVKTLSKGSITIEPIWDAGNDTEAGFETGVIQHVTKGDFELGIAASRAWNGAGFTSFDVLQAPFLIDNDALAEAVATSDSATKMLEGMSSAGVVGLTLWPEDLRHPFAIPPQTPLLSPEDFAGLNIRATPSGISSALVEALGGTTVFDTSDYQGAESGLRAGASLTGRPIATGNVTFFAKYQVLFANSSAFEELTDEQRSILREAATAIQKKAIAEHPREVAAAKAWCSDGGTIVMASEEQIATFEKAAQPVFDQIEQDPTNAEYIAAIRDLKASTEPSLGAEACVPAVASVTPEPTTDTAVWSEGLPPNGTWQVELTTEDIVNMGVLRSNAEGWGGVFTWTFQDGKATWHQQQDATNSFGCEATYEVVEDFVRITYTRDSKDCGNGYELDDIQWRLEDDGLHLHLVAITIAPFFENRAYLEAKPWQRIE
jgi:TRAP-type C4-dicarboxylate transport system substrate-binding protein